MGIPRGAARLLLDECSKRSFNGSVLQLGRQKFFFNLAQLKEWAPLHNVTLVENTPVSKPVSELVQGDSIDDKTFFYKLGFDSVESCDYSSFQEADHVFDLNLPVPSHLHNKYDVIVDFGTTEHIFNLPQVLKNLHDMLKVGGRVIHMLPSSNWVDHGFYMFSPTLFHDYYSANKWQIETARIIELTRRHDVDAWRVYEYMPGVLNPLSSGGFDKGYLLNIFFVVTKTEQSTADNIPQQSRYQEGKWQDDMAQHDVGINTKPLSSAVKLKVQYVAGWLKSIPLLYSVVSSIYGVIFRKNRMPPLVAKY
jgi:SAM-dependent methyltransferase